MPKVLRSVYAPDHSLRLASVCASLHDVCAYCHAVYADDFSCIGLAPLQARPGADAESAADAVIAVASAMGEGVATSRYCEALSGQTPRSWP